MSNACLAEVELGAVPGNVETRINADRSHHGHLGVGRKVRLLKVKEVRASLSLERALNAELAVLLTGVASDAYIAVSMREGIELMSPNTK